MTNSESTREIRGLQSPCLSGCLFTYEEVVMHFTAHVTAKSHCAAHAERACMAFPPDELFPVKGPALCFFVLFQCFK